MADQDINIVMKLRDQFSAEMKKVNDNMTSLANKVKTSWVDVSAKVYLAKQAYQAIIVPIRAVVQAAVEQEDALNRLRFALEAQGVAAGEVVKRYSALANEFQRTTRYGDDAILDVMKTLSVVGGVTEKDMKRATQAVLDFSTLTGRDLGAASMTIAKAAAGFTGELSRYGIILDENITKSQKFEKTLQFIGDRMGGAAQNDADNFAGAMAKVGNQFGDLLEKIGGIITQSPAIINLIETVAKGLEEINNVAEKLGRNKLLMTFASKGVIGVFGNAQDDKAWREWMDSKFADGPTSSVGSGPGPSQWQQAQDGFVAGLKTMQDKYKDFSNNIKAMTENMVTSMESSMGDFIYDGFLNKFENAKEIFANFCKSLLREWSNMIARMVVYQSMAGLGTAFSKSSSGWVQSIGTFFSGLAKHQTGTSYVGRTGPAFLHRGEAVIPAHRVSDYRTGNGGGGGNVIINMIVKAWDAADVTKQGDSIAAVVAQKIKSNAGLRGVIKQYG